MPVAPASLTPVRLETERLVIAPATVADVPRLLAFHRVEEERLGQWSPPRPDDFLTDAHFRERVARFAAEADAGVALRLFLYSRNVPFATAPVLGLIGFTQILALPVPQAQIGYGLGAAHEGRGLMAEALEAAIAHVGRARGLRRVVATYDVDNARSARLLARLGFVVEGILRAHLFTGGELRDHVAVAKTLPAYSRSVSGATAD